MRRILKLIVFNAASIWIVSQLLGNVVLGKGFETLLLTAVVLGLINLLIKPIVNLLLLPVNLITLGMFRWVVNVVTLYLVTVIVTDFKINHLVFEGFSYRGLSIPAFSLNLILSFVVVTFFISLVTDLLEWVSR